MNELIEKIIERVEKLTARLGCWSNDDGFDTELLRKEDVLDIVHEEAKAYNNGWIPCEKELPEDGFVVDLSCEYMGTHYETVGYFKNGNRGHSYIVDNDVFMRSAVLAWRPRPIPYQPSNSKNSNNWKQQTMSRFERVE